MADSADTTGVLASAVGVATGIPSAGLGEEAKVEDTLMTGLLMTDTVLVVDPCNGVALVAAGDAGRKGRLLAGRTDTEASAVVTGVSPLALSVVSCRLPNNLLSLSLSRA